LVQAWQGKAEFIKYNAISASAKGTSFSLFLDNNQEGSIIPQKERIKTQLLGVFSVANAVSAIAVSHNQGLTIETIKNSLETVNGLPGRLEKIDEGQNFTVIVDYAFEPNALNKLFDTVEMLLENQAASHPELVDRHIIQVLGAAGGGRDTWRRPEIGKISGARASFVIITNEDPYDDDPQVIIEQVAAGAEYSGKQVEENLFKILDRREAIRFAFSLAREGDIVLITGKGSEQAICLAQGEKIPWDDRQVAREELKNVLQNN
jgi:UDP-N-acetylmuramoyl-L-alanyl-D-glutamate--2,6-diaminopimelate ligase